MSLLSGILVGGRIAGMIVTAPVFGSRNYPLIARVGLMLFLTILVAPFAQLGNLAIDLSSNLDFFIYLLNEVIIGLFLGLIVSLFISFTYFAGDLIDYLIGFSMVSVVNPMDESQMAISSNILYVFATLIFLSLNLHHKVILALVYSFRVIEVGSFVKVTESLSYFMEIVANSLVVGLAVAAPFVITVLVADIVLGLLSKAMPGMNIFILGMPFKILIGLLLFLVLVPLLSQLLGSEMDAVFPLLKNYIEEFGR